MFLTPEGLPEDPETWAIAGEPEKDEAGYDPNNHNPFENNEPADLRDENEANEALAKEADQEDTQEAA